MINIDSHDAANRLAALMRLAQHERHAAAEFLGLDAGIVDLLPSIVENEMPTRALHDAALLGRFIVNEAVIQGFIAAFRGRDTESGGSR